MKVADLVSALEELGAVYRHSTKSEPKPCIKQVLELLKGKEQFTLAELKIAAEPKKKAAAGKPKVAKAAKVFAHEEHLSRLLDAKSEASFAAAIEALQNAKPTKEHVANLLSAYTGITPKKSTKKDELFDSLTRSLQGRATSRCKGAIR